jgi:amidase
MSETAPAARDIAADVRARRRSPREVVDAALARIQAEDGQIGAFQVVDADGARRAADELDGRDDLSDLPLAGVPVAIKDNVAVAGLPTRHGSAATSAKPEPADDELVRRLRAAGAIVVGKTRMPELAIWGFTESLAHGGTRNPRSRDRNAGGSTGGGAAAVAAGLVPLALGSDGGGSLRIPAANCGVVAFKPARGVVPLAGGLADHWFGCSAFGPLATNVADVVLALDVLCGDVDWRSPTSVDVQLRVAVSLRSPSPIGPPGRPARAAVEAAASLAAAAGHRLVRANPPYPLTMANIWVECWHAGIAEEAEHLDLRVDQVEARTRTMVRKGNRLRARGRPTGRAARAWRARALRWFDAYDVMISPVIAHPAPPFGWGARASYGRAYLNGARSTPFTQAWNVAGFPALSVPLGGTRDAPGSVQLVAAPGREAALITLATSLERTSTKDN